MIDANTESLISRPVAAGLLSRRRRGKKPHVSCVYRSTTTGSKGVILESLQCCGTRVTSKEALACLMKAQTYGADRSAVRSPTKRRRAADKAVQALDRVGV